MNLLNELVDFVFPRVCLMCGARLHPGEDCLCLPCLRRLPRTNYHLQRNNPIEKRFFGQFPLERATAYMHYIKGNEATRILHCLKYYNRPRVGLLMGRMMAAELMECGFFEGVDYLVPVPLAAHRLHHRGYNQCDWLAKGISSVTRIPVADHLLFRMKDNDTQTHHSANERRENVENLFEINMSSKSLDGGHYMLIDDVVTTGATLIACAMPLKDWQDVKLSVLTLACASSM